MIKPTKVLVNENEDLTEDAKDYSYLLSFFGVSGSQSQYPSSNDNLQHIEKIKSSLFSDLEGQKIEGAEIRLLKGDIA